MAAPQTMLKISELARRTGVSVATIHFYIREGLLPRPTFKTSRNMAWYDESFLARIRFIRRLQEERRLPLRVICSLLSGEKGGEEDAYPSLVELEALAIPSLEDEARGEAVGRASLVERTGVDPLDLDDLIELGLVTPTGSGAEARFAPVDVAIVETVASARSLGLSRGVFPTSDLMLYQRALSKLVGEEVPLFARRVKGAKLELPPDKVVKAGVQLMGQLITHLRRKLILDLMAGFETKPAGEQREERARPRSRGKAEPAGKAKAKKAKAKASGR